MEKNENIKIAIVGTGKVAAHLAYIFRQKGFVLSKIVGRNAEKVAALAQMYDTEGGDFSTHFGTETDLVVIAVSDSAIENVAQSISNNIDNQIVAHTSGTVPTAVLSPFFKNYGAFYPLQTFSEGHLPDFSQIPIFVNGDSIENQQFIQNIAKQLSDTVYDFDDKNRQALHIAAIFANNFTNHLLAISDNILSKTDIPFNVLLPLIAETFSKVAHHAPHTVQTGPAQRGDVSTVYKHLEYLRENAPPQYFDIYKVLSNAIMSS